MLYFNSTQATLQADLSRHPGTHRQAGMGTGGGTDL